MLKKNTTMQSAMTMCPGSNVTYNDDEYLGTDKMLNGREVKYCMIYSNRVYDELIYSAMKSVTITATQ